MIFRTLVALVVSVLALAAASVATAAAPVITDRTIALHSLGPDPVVSDICGFDVEVANAARIRILEYADGTISSHHHETYYWQANGKTLVEADNFTITDSGTGTLAFRGTVFNLHVPGVGPVMVEAGIAVFERGEVVKLAGLHQVLSGTSNVDAICDYFAA